MHLFTAVPEKKQVLVLQSGELRKAVSKAFLELNEANLSNSPTLSMALMVERNLSFDAIESGPDMVICLN